VTERFGHPRQRRFGEYLAGLLDAAEEASFEAHVAQCRECAQQLQSEAMLDLLLHEAAEPARSRRLPRVEKLARFACAAMAMAAAILFMLADPTRFLQTDRLDESTGPSDDVIALFANSVCMPPAPGEDATCEEPLTVAMATVPPSDGRFGFDAFAPGPVANGGGCWADEQVIDPLCVTTDPLAG
jgi:hypothetical protein